jgi:HD-GYP domain-containing protein (c-di-GMP phosphodiesterase class II)
VRAVPSGGKESAALAGAFNHMAAQIEAYVERLVQSAQENRELFVNSIRMIALAIDAKDPYTRGHSDRVCAYALGLAREMGFKGLELDEVHIAAMLHDVGKIGIDDRVLRKPSTLNDDEFDMVKAHPFQGAQIMDPVPQLKRIIPGIKYHHENWAGGGYPEGLKGAEIPVLARIIAVADTFDAMTTDRPYQGAISGRYAAEKIRSLVGKRFDPQIVDAFLKAFEKGEIHVDQDAPTAA